MRALDSRGYGPSGGLSGAGGEQETADVDAAVGAARAGGARAVVTLGLSMGGGAVLRQVKGPAAPTARTLAAGPRRRPPGGRRRHRADPAALVHGDRDGYFPLEHFAGLVRAAGPAATSWVVPAFGHAENGACAPARRADRAPGFWDDRTVTSTAAPSAVPGRAHHVPAAGLAALVTALLAGLPAAFDGVGSLAAVLVLQLALVLSWVLVADMRGFAASLAVGTAAAVAGDLVLVLPQRPVLGGLLAVLGVGFLAAVLQQMLRTPRQALVDSLAGSALLLAAVGALAALLLLGRSDEGRLVVTALAAGVSLVVGHLVDRVLPRPQVADGVPRGLAGLVLSVLAGAGVAVAARDFADLGLLRSLLVGAVVAGVVALVAVAASYVAVEAAAEGVPGGLSPWVLTVVQVALPMAAAAPVALGLLMVL